MSTPKMLRTDGIQYKIITNGQEILARGCFSELNQILSRHDQGGEYHGVYLGEALIHFLCDGIVLKPYQIWVKVDDHAAIKEPCSPYWKIKELMEQKLMRMTECVITVGDRIIESHGLNTIKDMGISEQTPLWIRQQLHIPFWVSVDGLTGYEMICDMKPNEEIDSFVKRRFGETAFAFIQSAASVLAPGATCQSIHTHGYPGFNVKSRFVRIKKQHGNEQKEDLSDCRSIEDVVKKLNGAYLYHNNRLLQGDELLDNVIMDSDDDFFLYITAKIQEANFIFSQSILTTAKTNSGAAIHTKTIEYGIYSHHLAIKVYDAWTKGHCYDGSNRDIISNFQNVSSWDAHPLLLPHETTYSSMLSVELQYLLEPCNCFHQVALKHHVKGNAKEAESKPDFCCITRIQGLPSIIMVGDFKLNDKEFNTALAQSFGYCMDVFTHSDKPKPIIAIPGTKKQFCLYLCFLVVVGKESKLVTIEIGSASLQSDKEMRSFLSALKCAVSEVATGKYSGNFCVEPKPGLFLQLQLNSSRRVYKLGKKVYKLYNLNQLKPNIHVMNKIQEDYFVDPLSCDGCIVAYVSKYTTQKTNLLFTDFKPIMQALDMLHTNGYVHSDVRIANLLFPVDSSQGSDVAKLIDFDLADVEGEPYPDGYNKINERHPGATANSPRSKLHDRYSIISIIEKQSFYSKFSDCNKELLTSVKEDKCDMKLENVFDAVYCS